MKRSIRPLLHAAALTAALLLGAGCGATAVKPWDHDLLAQKKMSFNPTPHEAATDDHIYFSKEGSTGGQTPDGGGCGCN